MNQSRTRKAPAVGETKRSRPPLTKASGDMPKTTKEPHNIQHQLQTKNRIPKEIRYDLENALVGLCDVWFEDIKPHLLRNNIKLHVKHGAANESEAGGDRGRLPPGAPGCSHIDPGAALDRQRHRSASSADSCLMQPETLRARSCKPRQPPIKLLSPLHSPTTVLMRKNPKNSEEKAVPVNVQDERVRRRARCPQSQCSVQLVPRLSRTYSSPPQLPPMHYITPAKQLCHSSQQSVREEVVSYLVIHPPTKNQSTQTDPQPRRRESRALPKRRRANSHIKRRIASKSPAHQQKSPTQQQKSPTQQKSRAGRQTSPAKRQGSPEQQKNSPTRQHKSPTQQQKSLAGRQNSPAKRQKSPAKSQNALERRQDSPGGQHDYSVWRQESPVWRREYHKERHESPVCQQQYPVKRQETRAWRQKSPSPTGRQQSRSPERSLAASAVPPVPPSSCIPDNHAPSGMTECLYNPPFQDDLIDLVQNLLSYDTDIQTLLIESPRRYENLVTLNHNNIFPDKKARAKNLPPWR